MEAITTTETKEICWLPRSLALKIKSLENGASEEAEVLKYLSDTKRSFRQDIEALDDDVLQYRASMIRAKNALKEAFETELTDFEKVWEQHADQFAKIKQRAMQTVEDLKPVKAALKEVADEMSKIDRWNIESLLETIKKVENHLDTDGSTGKVLKFLFENYKR